MKRWQSCDQCGDPIVGLHLIIRPRLTPDADVTFLDGSWNGGEYCSLVCAGSAISKLRPPAGNRPGFTL